VTRVVLALALGLSAAGCGEELGGFCKTDSDCRAGLRCSSASEGVRGVCVYDKGGGRSDARGVDRGSLVSDGGAERRARDLARDAGREPAPADSSPLQ
jgi:hypothetical protein